MSEPSDDECGREGPRVVIKRYCDECRWVISEHYAVQGDSGYEVYCTHPSRPSGNRIGDTTWSTPDWCPMLTQGGQEPR